jgi:hypothetical protein
VADDRDTVTIRSRFGEERDIHPSAIPFFTNDGWVVLKSDGSVNPKPVTPANNSDKKD